jgi:hypothetical protein
MSPNSTFLNNNNNILSMSNNNNNYLRLKKLLQEQKYIIDQLTNKLNINEDSIETNIDNDRYNGVVSMNEFLKSNQDQFLIMKMQLESLFQQQQLNRSLNDHFEQLKQRENSSRMSKISTNNSYNRYQLDKTTVEDEIRNISDSINDMKLRLNEAHSGRLTALNNRNKNHDILQPLKKQNAKYNSSKLMIDNVYENERQSDNINKRSYQLPTIVSSGNLTYNENEDENDYYGDVKNDQNMNNNNEKKKFSISQRLYNEDYIKKERQKHGTIKGSPKKAQKEWKK